MRMFRSKDNGNGGVRLDVKKVLPKVCFAVFLLLLSKSAPGIYYRASDLGLGVVLALVSAALLLKNVIANSKWRSTVNAVDEDLSDLVYISSGMTIIQAGPKLIPVGSLWLPLVLLAGTALAGWGVGVLMAKSLYRLITANPRLAVVVGAIMVSTGAIILGMTWAAIVAKPGVNAATPEVLIGVGLTTLYFAERRLRRRTIRQKSAAR